MCAGLDRRFGWPIVATAAVTAVLPDWDGLSLLLGPALFDQLHRAAGHNLLAGASLGAAFAALDYRYSLVCRAAQWFRRRLPRLEVPSGSPVRQRFRAAELTLWIAVGVTASLSHLAVDLVFSGHRTLADWGLPLFWPFSDRRWVFPMVRWGDAMPTLIFVAGMFAMVRWPGRRAPIARLTLVAVAAYIVARGMTLTLRGL